ncbi:MAG TPA: PepSY domain-containing protein [Candidatus Angelobacter sp.]|nr:PepSY domain-containing protein [Candidatus Angelobacter sp.]
MKKGMAIFTAFALFGLMPVTQMAHASQNASSDMTEKKVTREQAEEIALNEINAHNKSIIHIHLETDDGYQMYEVLVKADKDCYEVEIDAKTGKVLEVEKEMGHDYDRQNEN